MDLASVILSVLIVVILAALAVFLRRGNTSSQEAPWLQSVLALQREMSSLKSSMQDQMVSMTQQMNNQLKENTQILQRTHEGYHDSLGQVQHRLGELHQVSQSMLDVGKDISSLQDILKAPKLRGGLGELFLAELLRQILPEEHFELQYSFRDGRKVDAVIRLGEGLIPIDAKFPLENFKRFVETEESDQTKIARKAFYQDVKKHIDQIASKYILPEEGTFDFAMMYIPAENIYYEIILRNDVQAESLSAYALKKKIIPVSPNSFYAYLQTIVRGLRGLKIERSAQRILESLGQLDTDLDKIMVDFEKTGGHLANAQSSYERTLRSFDKLRIRVASLESAEPEVSLLSGSVSQEKA